MNNNDAVGGGKFCAVPLNVFVNFSVGRDFFGVDNGVKFFEVEVVENYFVPESRQRVNGCLGDGVVETSFAGMRERTTRIFMAGYALSVRLMSRSLLTPSISAMKSAMLLGTSAFQLSSISIFSLTNVDE